MDPRDLPCGCSIVGRTGTDLESCLLVYLKPSPARESGQRGVLEKRQRTTQKPAAAFRDIQTYTACPDICASWGISTIPCGFETC